jgi:hypothetical protein
LSSGQLVANGATTSCDTSSTTGGSAGYYYRVNVSFTYTPIFKGATVTSLLNTTITQDSWMRLK